MNDISRSIEYAQFSWNPITGCEHGCNYCYARRIATRFKPKDAPALGPAGGLQLAPPGEAFPYGFAPTWHPHRLSEPQAKKAPAIVFCCDMADLWGDWVPRWAQEKVLEATHEARQHIYLMLTKAPENYPDTDLVPRNVWEGTTVESRENLSRVDELVDQYDRTCTLWVSAEPLLGPIVGDWVGSVDWIVLGAQTGPGAVPPDREWVQDLVDCCRDFDVPIFMKSNLAAVWGKELIRQWPVGAKGHLPVAGR